jgi:hypothetical protein
MIVSDKIIWLHIPKTAGDATLRMFAEVPVAWRLFDPHTDPRKHGVLADAWARAPGSESCAVIANLRRLPEILVSYFHHMQRHAPDQLYANGRRFAELAYREYLHFVLEHPEQQSYDWILDNHLGDREPDHFLRVSDLGASFLDVVGRYHAIPADAKPRIEAVRANVGPYQRGGPADWFTRDEMETLYRNCPRWTRTERMVYGNTLLEDVAWSWDSGRSDAGA